MKTKNLTRKGVKGVKPSGSGTGGKYRKMTGQVYRPNQGKDALLFGDVKE